MEIIARALPKSSSARAQQALEAYISYRVSGFSVGFATVLQDRDIAEFAISLDHLLTEPNAAAHFFNREQTIEILLNRTLNDDCILYIGLQNDRTGAVRLEIHETVSLRTVIPFTSQINAMTEAFPPALPLG